MHWNALAAMANVIFEGEIQKLAVGSWQGLANGVVKTSVTM